MISPDETARNYSVLADICAFLFLLWFIYLFIMKRSPRAHRALPVRLDQLAPCNVVPALHCHTFVENTLSEDGVEGTISHKQETCVLDKCNHCHSNRGWNL